MFMQLKLGVTNFLQGSFIHFFFKNASLKSNTNMQLLTLAVLDMAALEEKFTIESYCKQSEHLSKGGRFYRENCIE